AIHQNRGLFHLEDAGKFELRFVHPYTHHLRDRTATSSIAFNPDAKMPPGYGSHRFLEQLDRDKPNCASTVIDRPPALLWVYPFGYYLLLACWIGILSLINNSLVFIFFGCRLLSVLLLVVSLLATFGSLREMRYGRGFSLLLTAIVGFFPLTSFVSS